MFVGIERTTDVRYPETKIKKFTTTSAALKWLKEKRPEFAWPGAATQDVPVSQQNWHRRLRDVYQIRPNFRLMKSAVEALYDYRSPRAYVDRAVTLYLRNSVGKLNPDTSQIEPLRRG